MLCIFASDKPAISTAKRGKMKDKNIRATLEASIPLVDHNLFILFAKVILVVGENVQ